MNIRQSFLLAMGSTLVLAGCGAGGNDQGLEYAPNMYHAVSYEPLKQITDKESGMWVNSSDDEIGEYYSSNPNNPHGMNMLEPVPNTVRRGDYLPYRIPKDSLTLAARIIMNPLDSSSAIINDGKVLYGKFCTHCHGSTGEGDGKVSEKLAGIANLKGQAYKNLTDGHIFHVVSMGKGLMGAHGSQLSQEERWKIVRYVQILKRQ